MSRLRAVWARLAGGRTAALERALDKERSAHARLQRHVAALPRYAHGSLTPGVPGWHDRWRDAQGRRILLYARVDHAGSLMRWATAINTHTDYAARLAVLVGHEYGYDGDLAYWPAADVADTGLLALAAEADVIHVKDEKGFSFGRSDLDPDRVRALGKPVVFTQYGAFGRMWADDDSYRRAVGAWDAHVAVTPDLNEEWLAGYVVPQAVDVHAFPYSWRDGRRLGHSPSTGSKTLRPEAASARKGTASLLRAIEGLDVELELITGVPHEECLARKARCNLFFDQAGREQENERGTNRPIGWYGNSGVEAAVLGIPTIAHISEQSLAGAARAGRDIRERCAIVNTGLEVEEIRRTISGLLELSPAERSDLSLRTRTWVEEFHSHEAVAAELARVYDALLTRG